jgi:RNA polymerase sigma-70 factor (ECF subfamily)
MLDTEARSSDFEESGSPIGAFTQGSREATVHAAIASPKIRPRLLACARRILQNPADAEDCVQDALITATLLASQFESRATPTAWLYRIVENTCRMKRRALRRLRRGGDVIHVPMDEALGLAEPDTRWNPENTMRGKQALECLDSELSRLGARDAQLFRRHVMEGVPLRALAREHQISSSAIKSRLFRVRRRLHETLI